MPEAAVTNGESSQAPYQRNEWELFCRVFFQKKIAVLALFIICLTFIVAIFAPWIAPYDPNAQDLSNSMQPPSRQHLLGTDRLGMDTFSRIVWGSRTALIVGFSTTLISAFIGTVLGLLAGYFGGIINTVIMRYMDALMGFPMIVLALLLAGVLGPGMQNIIIALTVASVPGYVRIMCSMTLSVKENDYILAQRSIGSSSARTLFLHILPNAVQPMIVMITSGLGGVILGESGLSFLGVGITPPDIAWGSMVADGFKYLKTNPILSLAPGLAILLIVLSFNILGDSLRDALDPKLRGVL